MGPDESGISIGHDTLHRVIDELARSDRSMTFLIGSESRRFSYERLGANIRQAAGALRACECRQQDRVLLILPDGDQFLQAFFGAIWAGIIPVPLYPPFLFQQLDSYSHNIARVAGQCRAKLVVTSGAVAALLGTRDIGAPLVAFEDLPAGERQTPTAVEGHSPAFIQYTSGSTAAPKGVVVTHRALLTNAECLIDHMQLNADHDRGVSWLPFYHDMGLIGGMLVPLMVQGSVWYMSPLDFIRRPTSWCDLIHQTRATVQFAPNFAYGLLARSASDEDLDRWDLSCWRVAGCGAEPIRADVIKSFQERFARASFKPEAMLACYGLAEATLAVTLAGLTTPARTLVVDAEALRRSGVAIPVEDHADGGTVLLSCGRPIPGHDVRIVTADGAALEDGMEGEIQVSGPCVMTGYFADPQSTAATLLGEWLATGDLGFLFDGELYVTGRSKDVIVSKGRNIHPQDIEWDVGELEGVRRGNVVACGIAMEEEEVLLVLEASAAGSLDQLALKIGRAVSSQHNVPVHDVVIVEQGTLPKTTSGKLRRYAVRAAYEAKTLRAAHARSGNG